MSGGACSGKQQCGRGGGIGPRPNARASICLAHLLYPTYYAQLLVATGLGTGPQREWGVVGSFPSPLGQVTVSLGPDAGNGSLLGSGPSFRAGNIL